MEIWSLCDLAGNSRRGCWIWQEGNDSCHPLGSASFHGGDGQNQFHYAIVDVLIFKRFDYDDFVPSHIIEQLNTNFPIIESISDVPAESCVEVSGYLFA